MSTSPEHKPIEIGTTTVDAEIVGIVVGAIVGTRRAVEMTYTESPDRQTILHHVGRNRERTRAREGGEAMPASPSADGRSNSVWHDVWKPRCTECGRLHAGASVQVGESNVRWIGPVLVPLLVGGHKDRYAVPTDRTCCTLG